MFRFARFLFTLVALGSALLCVAVCVAGANRGTAREVAFARFGGPLFVFASHYGRVGVLAIWPWPHDELQTMPDDSQWVLSATEYDCCWGLIRYAKSTVIVPEWPDGQPASLDDSYTHASELTINLTKPEARTAALDLPASLLAGMLAVFPGLWLIGLWVRRANSRRKWRRLICPSCNYDLRATPTRCPECGSAWPSHG